MHLAIVIPVYNEEQHIVALLKDWQPVFDATGSPYRVILIDDGSTDKSLEILKSQQKKDAALSVHTQPNAGHGPAILRGYRMALDADWVFQIDSDHQLDMFTFCELWSRRNQYDLLLGERKEKNASFSRRCVSFISGLIVHTLFGRGITDVNTPYRLIRSESLREALEKIPANSFAPNILLTAWFVEKKRRIFTTKTGLRGGLQQRTSKMNGYFLRGAVRSALQTLLFRIR
ncbi:MAG TPA: glycosyltransferase family 2 protein [Puia sp.]|jgi:glycosyltransferase involved in cell wall biosynthesis|nr:glycosyltransferase family 2 protein [Puia sp.]